MYPSITKVVLYNFSKLRSEAFWVLFGQIGAAAGGLFGLKVLTRLMEPAEFGQLAIASTIVLLIGNNVFGPVSQGLMRFWSISQERGQIQTYVYTARRCMRLLFFTTGLGGIGALGFVFFHHSGDWGLLLALAVIVGGFTGWFGVRTAIIIAARKRKAVALMNCGGAFLKPLLMSILLFFFARKSTVAMAGFLFSMVLMVIVSEGYFKRFLYGQFFHGPVTSPAQKRTSDIGREILKFAWPFFIWGLFSWVHQYCDRWALQIFYGENTVGVFSAVTQLSIYPLIFLSAFLSSFFMPIAYDRAGDLNSSESMASANRVILYMIGIYALATSALIVVFGLFHASLLTVFSNVRYTKLSYLLPGLTGAWALFYLGQMLSGFGMIANKPHLYILPICVSGVLAMVLTFTLSATSGPPGVSGRWQSPARFTPLGFSGSPWV